MKINKMEEKLVSVKSDRQSNRQTRKDSKIDIFCESLNEYLEKLNDAKRGRYELDNYDKQVLSIALDQHT